MKKRLLILSVVLTLAALSAYGQTVTGRVTASQDNAPLPGVSVLVKGTSIGTTTDADGNYTLSLGGNENAVLTFSFIGFVTQEVSASGRTSVDVVMTEDITSLNEVVVTALGISRDKKALGYAVSTVNSEDITRSGNTNFTSALYGKAAGVRITTAPGGASSAANIQIRGINSINFNSAPLYVVDGIMIRNTVQTNNPDKTGGFNNNGYWDDQRIRGNGALDINPSDIESVNILKGASATALYGSEAANGVVVITTKRGSKAAGLGVDFNYTYNVEEVAFTPKYQNTYGPGYPRDINLANGANEDGWIPVDLDGNGTTESLRPYFRAYGQFGPKMEGQMVPWWDGQMRPYSAQPDNYKDIYQTGFNSNFNIGVSNATDKYNYRLAYTRMDYKGITPGMNMNRNIVSLNSSLKLNEKVSADIVINYNNSYVHNRPEAMERVLHNYGGFFSRADDMSVYFDKYQTSQGYKWVPYNLTERNPEEAIKYNIRATDFLDYLWRNLKNSEEEFQDRLLSSITLNYEIIKGLKLRGRFGSDLTTITTEKKEHNEYPLAFNGSSSTGNYRVSNGKYVINYGDALLTYTKPINDFEVGVSGGFQVREETYRDQSVGTDGGLVTENWFSLNNSFNQRSSSGTRAELLRYAYLGLLNLSYKNFLFLEATARQEYSSTLPPGSNSFFYPSVNASFVFSDAFNMPVQIGYGKLRMSYGVAGTTPPIYSANILYEARSLPTSLGSVPSLNAKSSYGNNDIKPEDKHEFEVGIEARGLDNKIGFDVAYYNSRIVDQLLRITIPTTSGASSVLANIGELRSQGVEVVLNGTPVSIGDFRWDTRLTFAKSTTKAHKLVDESKRLITNRLDQDAVLVVIDEGGKLGDILVHPRMTDEDGNYIIDADGYYTMDFDSYKKVGNILPDATGGWGNTLTYKGLSLDFMIDYKFGGELVSTPHLYATGAGMYESTMAYRDEANGGLPYFIDAANGNRKTLLSSHTASAPDGSRVYHDGVILRGVTETGESNEMILDAPSYYFNHFTWGQTGLYEEGAVLKNDYIKMREVTLSYNLPRNISDKLRLNRVRVSLIGRNLFYLYRTLDNLDPEVAIGSRWNQQGIDEGSAAATRSYGFSINASF